jgi:hypothetical protein
VSPDDTHPPSSEPPTAPELPLHAREALSMVREARSQLGDLAIVLDRAIEALEEATT